MNEGKEERNTNQKVTRFKEIEGIEKKRFFDSIKM
jgi:hypothetical protein